MENKIEEVKQQKAVKNMENIKTYSVEEILKIISQAGNDKKKLPRDIIMLLENMQNISKAEDKENTEKNMAVGSIGYIEGLSLEDIKAINEYAAKQVENYVKAQFDINNPAHREYFEYFKQQALKEKEKEIKLRKFDESLHEKYGDMYESVEQAARSTFESMAFKDARDILSSRMHGNVEKLLSFYDSVFNEVVNKKEQMEKEAIKDSEKNIIFPPKALNGSSVKTTANKNTYENFI